MENSGEKYFYIQNFKYTQNGDIDISFLPMMVRRRLSPIDKYAIYTLSEFKDVKIDELVYSSRYGELERLFKIIDQYLEDNEVSPNLFSSSVHNYLVGLFSQINNLTTSYTSISAENNSFSMGLLKSILSDKTNSLYCYVDKENEKINSVSCLISKTSGNIKCRLKREKVSDNQNEFVNFIDFLNGKLNKVDFGCYSIERVN
mgnify:CR=1 FL=1